MSKAARNNRCDIIKVILQCAGQELCQLLLKMTDFKGGTALHLAAEFSHQEAFNTMASFLSDSFNQHLLKMRDANNCTAAKIQTRVSQCQKDDMCFDNQDPIEDSSDSGERKNNSSRAIFF